MQASVYPRSRQDTESPFLRVAPSIPFSGSCGPSLCPGPCRLVSVTAHGSAALSRRRSCRVSSVVRVFRTLRPPGVRRAWAPGCWGSTVRTMPLSVLPTGAFGWLPVCGREDEGYCLCSCGLVMSSLSSWVKSRRELAGSYGKYV